MKQMKWNKWEASEKYVNISHQYPPMRAPPVGLLLLQPLTQNGAPADAPAVGGWQPRPRSVKLPSSSSWEDQVGEQPFPSLSCYLASCSSAAWWFSYQGKHGNEWHNTVVLLYSGIRPGAGEIQGGVEREQHGSNAAATREPLPYYPVLKALGDQYGNNTGTTRDRTGATRGQHGVIWAIRGGSGGWKIARVTPCYAALSRIAPV